MILNIPRKTILVCLATLVVNASVVHAQTYNDNGNQTSLRRQSVSARQYSRPDVDTRTARQDSSVESTARIMLDDNSNVVDLRDSPERSIDHPHQVDRSQSPVRFASYESSPIPSAGNFQPTASVNLPSARNADRGAFATDTQPAQQASDMASVGHAFQTIRADDGPKRRSAGESLQHREDIKTSHLERQRFSDSAGLTNSDPSEQVAAAGSSFANVGGSGTRQMIEKIAYNTLFVLVFGVGFVFLARVWIKPAAGKNAAGQDTIEVISSLKLPAKSNLMLVNVGGEKLLVAIDSSGVKSVVHLTDTFANKLAAYSEVADEAVEAEQRTNKPVAPVPEAKASKPSIYSLDSVLGGQAKKRSVKPDNAEKNTEAIREQMEAALLKFGLKGLV